jgi:hypothetical protein
MRHWRRDIGTEIVAGESLAGLVTDECRAGMCLMCISNGDVAAASTRARGLLAPRPSADDPVRAGAGIRVGTDRKHSLRGAVVCQS